MTGRDLIIYILENGLENESVVKNGSFVGYETESKFAERMGVGVETIKALIMLERIRSVRIGEIRLIPIVESKKIFPKGGTL